jgi:hypothetical protein
VRSRWQTHKRLRKGKLMSQERKRLRSASSDRRKTRDEFIHRSWMKDAGDEVLLDGPAVLLAARCCDFNFFVDAIRSVVERESH